jgi:hypothetical protein
MVINWHPMNSWDHKSDYFGASIASMIKLGKKKGYEPVHSTGGFNLFLVDRKYYPRFGIKDNSAEALYTKWTPGDARFNKHPEGRGDVPFSRPYISHGAFNITKKFILDR